MKGKMRNVCSDQVYCVILAFRYNSYYFKIAAEACGDRKRLLLVLKSLCIFLMSEGMLSLNLEYSFNGIKLER